MFTGVSLNKRSVPRTPVGSLRSGGVVSLGKLEGSLILKSYDLTSCPKDILLHLTQHADDYTFLFKL